MSKRFCPYYCDTPRKPAAEKKPAALKYNGFRSAEYYFGKGLMPPVAAPDYTWAEYARLRNESGEG